MKLITILLLFSSMVSASDLGFIETIDGRILGNGSAEIYEIVPGSDTFKLIETAISEIYHSPLKGDMCKLYPPIPGVLMYGLGVSFGSAREIVQICNSNDTVEITMPKIFPKKYYVAIDENADQPIQSWTTAGNQTVIYVDKNLDYSDLKRILIHEIAIAHDGKMKLLFTIYKRFTGENKSIFDIFDRPANVAAVNERLRVAFNMANYNPIAYTFATMRAFMLESIVEGENQRLTQTHEQCVEAFRRLLPTNLNNKDIFRAGVNTFQGMSEDSILEEYRSPPDLDRVLENLLDPKFILKDAGKKTFCQYMAIPGLTSRSYWSFHANGPRPRVVGGWKTANDDLKGKKSDFFGNTTPAAPLDKRVLKDIILGDIREQKIKELQKSGSNN